MQIVDARARVPLPFYLESSIYDHDVAMTSRAKRGYGEDETLRSGRMEDFLASMGAANISMAIVPGRAPNRLAGGGDNEQVLDFVRSSEGRFGAVFGIDAIRPIDVAATVHQIVEQGYLGVAVEPGIGDEPTKLDDRRIYPLYEALQAANLVVYATIGGSGGPHIDSSDPVAVDRVAVDFPALRIVLVHGGWPYVQETCGVLYRRPNVYCLPDVYFPNLPGEEAYLMAMKTYAQDRFLFGTSYPFAPLEEHVQRNLALPVSDQILEQFMGLNTMRLFGLEPTAD